MLAFHIDDGDYIQREGQTLHLSNDFPYDWYTPEIKELCLDLFDGQGVAHFGANFLDSVSLFHARSSLIELCYEMVRMRHFPNLPSRFQCLYACISQENIGFWKSFVPALTSAAVWLVEGHVAFLANATLLKATHFEGDVEYFDPALARRMALEYWGTGKLLDATSDCVHEAALGVCDRDFLVKQGVHWDDKAQPEILLKYPVKIIQKGQTP